MTVSTSQTQNPSSAMKQAADKVEQVEKKVERHLPTREEAEQMMEEWKDQLAEKWDQAKHYVQDFDTQAVGDQFTGTIRRYPWTSLAVSFAVGAVIGNRLFKR
ncbi:MAG: hypothetical protein ACOH5I_02585 [Oligoflexus sp.]